MDGQFSWPVRPVSPGCRAAHRDVIAWCDEPGFDDPLIGLTEVQLFRRIFACDEPGRDRT